MLNLNKLEIFNVVVEEGSFSRAAERLLMTQPAVSQHIQELEAALGTKLFERGRRGVRLTAPGETLHDYTRSILRLVAEAESMVANVGHLARGQLRIGATPGASAYILPEWIRSFRNRFEKLTVALHTAITDDVVEALFNRQSDIGVVEGELHAIPQRHLLGECALRPIELFVVVGRSHPWWHADCVLPQALNERPFIMRQPGSQTRLWTEQILEQAGVRPRVVAEFDNQESIKQAVISGMGITILPEYVIRHEREMDILRALPVEGVALRRTLKLIWNAQMPFAPITRAFLTHMAAPFPDLHALLNTTRQPPAIPGAPGGN